MPTAAAAAAINATGPRLVARGGMLGSSSDGLGGGGSDGDEGGTLVVCPTSLVAQWVEPLSGGLAYCATIEGPEALDLSQPEGTSSKEVRTWTHEARTATRKRNWTNVAVAKDAKSDEAV